MSDQKGVLKVAYENVCVCQLKEEVRACKLEKKISLSGSRPCSMSAAFSSTNFVEKIDLPGLAQ